MTIFASWYCTMKPLTTSGKGSVSVAGKHPLKRCRFRTTVTGTVAQNVSLLAQYMSHVKKSESSRKELSDFLCVFIRMQSS